MPDKQAFQRKLQAAQTLDLEVEETYTKIGEDYFQNFTLKKGDTVIKSKSFPIEPLEMLKNFRELRDELKLNVIKIQEKIDKIKGLNNE